MPEYYILTGFDNPEVRELKRLNNTSDKSAISYFCALVDLVDYDPSPLGFLELAFYAGFKMLKGNGKIRRHIVTSNPAELVELFIKHYYPEVYEGINTGVYSIEYINYKRLINKFVSLGHNYNICKRKRPLPCFSHLYNENIIYPTDGDPDRTIMELAMAEIRDLVSTFPITVIRAFCPDRTDEIPSSSDEEETDTEEDSIHSMDVLMGMFLELKETIQYESSKTVESISKLIVNDVDF